MKFSDRVEKRYKVISSDTISVEDIWRNDTQYRTFVASVTELLRRFSHKFNIGEDLLFKTFAKHVKEGL